ncbi:hypothetical protein FOVG_18074 [Fusarium oxysporum f. sp. pisi HDV247]|uniref:Uncharacterized protein n=1 Tax=Fusarium oxysporum f. sp. pisi HDV247 TaxID=1080344 RepID=W9NRW4_FUSOX|nr:hypothetical protein FOVG_18074 [Fusarium oxysporum f. sp. pisi HDV247]
MNNIEYFPEIEDESTELNFVDSDYPLDEHSTLEDAPLSSFVDQPDLFGLGMDSMPQAINDLSSIDFSPPTVEGDLHFNYPDPSPFAITASSNSLLNFPKTQGEIYPGDMLPSGSLDLDFTL